MTPLLRGPVQDEPSCRPRRVAQVWPPTSVIRSTDRHSISTREVGPGLHGPPPLSWSTTDLRGPRPFYYVRLEFVSRARPPRSVSCLLYTSDAADDLLCVD